MKNTPLRTTFVLACLLLLYSLSARSQVLLSDNFDDGVINGVLWQPLLPFGQSSLVEANGYMTSTGRGTLATVSGFSGGIIISGQFRQFDSLDQFKVTLRSDLSLFESYAERTGITIAFDTVSSVIRIEQRDPSYGIGLGTVPFSFTAGQTYDFTITDTGSEISVAIDGSPLVTGTSTFSTGDRVAFFSREFSFNSAQFDNVVISAVPEPSMIGLTIGGLLVLLVRSRQKPVIASRVVSSAEQAAVLVLVY